MTTDKMKLGGVLAQIGTEDSCLVLCKVAEAQMLLGYKREVRAAAIKNFHDRYLPADGSGSLENAHAKADQLLAEAKAEAARRKAEAGQPAG